MDFIAYLDSSVAWSFVDRIDTKEFVFVIALKLQSGFSQNKVYFRDRHCDQQNTIESVRNEHYF